MIIIDRFKATTLKLLNGLGYQVRKNEYVVQAERSKTKWLENLSIKTVLDIGANEGQFARHINQILPEAKIYAFEPLKDCYEKLNDNFKDSKTFKAFNVALGEKAEEATIHRTDFSQSSSLLPILDLHRESFPFAKDEQLALVKIVRLDDLEEELILEKPVLVKIDVQGFEDKVINGGRKIIEKADVLILELTIEPLFDGQLLFDEMYEMVRKLGFKYQGNLTQMHSASDGKIVQIDGIFVKTEGL